MKKKVTSNKYQEALFVFFSLFLTLSLSMCTFNSFSQGAAINTTAIAADKSAILDIQSDTLSGTVTSLGLLIPRMNTTRRNGIAAPVPKSLLIFNTTTNCFESFVNGVWNKVSCPGFTCGISTVNDIEGNTYHTVSLGTQCWLKENMRTKTYPNGSSITKGAVTIVITPADSSWAIDHAWYSYPPNSGNTGPDATAATVASFGLLYQWSAAVDSLTPGALTSGAQGICPSGWHVPTDAQWKTLEVFLGMCTGVGTDANLQRCVDFDNNWRGTNEGSKMAADFSNQSWAAYTNGIKDNTNFNTSGLAVGPSGFRGTNGGYGHRGYYSTLWTSTGSGSSAWFRYLNYAMTQVSRSNYGKAYGFSVRCLKDY